MKNKFHLTSIALVLSAIAVSGCAPKQAWSPELEEAREAYQRASSNPLVKSLAINELDQAQKQLQSAEDAADYFKGRETIAHEATLAHLKSLEAEQTARAQQAKQHLQLAQTGTLVPPALPDRVPGTFELTPAQQPVMAAAVPQANQSIQQTMPHAAISDPMQYSLQGVDDTSATSTHSMPVSVTSTAEAQQTELEKIAAQLAALSDQIARLQSSGTENVQSASPQADSRQLYNLQFDNNAQLQPSVVSIDSIESRIERSTAQPAYADPASVEPVLAAARPPLNSGDLNPGDLSPGNQYPANSYEAALPSANAPAVVADARLRGELRAMNARPSSRGMALALGERYFEAGSARLWEGRAARHLDNIAALMVENKDLVVDIEGHTDNQGTEEQKTNLTTDRAIAIKSALVLRGVDNKRINATGFSDSVPKATNNTSLGRLQNRRVEVVFPNVEGF